MLRGFGSRLQPLTNHLPKCLFPIQGQPLLGHWLHLLSDAGINDFLINTHYLHSLVKEWAEQSIFNDLITLTYENPILGTAGTLLNNLDFIGSEPIMLIHADNICTANFSAFIKAHRNRPRNTYMTMMTFTTDDPKSCGVVSLSSDGIIESFHEKVSNPPSNHANAAIYIIEPSMIRQLANQSPPITDFSTEVIPNHLTQIYTYHNDCYHRDIGTVSSYLQAILDAPYKPYKTSAVHGTT